MYAEANTRISCYAASDRTACAAFFTESRMKVGNATSLDRKSGAAEESAVRPYFSNMFDTDNLLLIQTQLREYPGFCH